MEPCDPEVFSSGTMVAMIADPRSTTIDAWVIDIAKRTGRRVDWHMAGGRAIVLVLGDAGDRATVRSEIVARRDDLIAAYMDAPDNWCPTPDPDDVQMVVYGDDGLTARDVVPHITADADGNLMLHDPEAAAMIAALTK